MTDREEIIARYLEKNGCIVLNKGWPDFLVIDPKADKAFAVEVKHDSDQLRPSQIAMHKWLKRMGLDIYVARSAKDVEGVEGRKMLTKGVVEQFIYWIEKEKQKIEKAHKESITNMDKILDALETVSVVFDKTSCSGRYDTLGENLSISDLMEPVEPEIKMKEQCREAIATMERFHK